MIWMVWGTSMFVICYAVIMPLSCRYFTPRAICQALALQCTCVCGDVWCVGPNRRTEQTLPLRQSIFSIFFLILTLTPRDLISSGPNLHLIIHFLALWLFITLRTWNSLGFWRVVCGVAGMFLLLLNSKITYTTPQTVIGPLGTQAT